MPPPWGIVCVSCLKHCKLWLPLRPSLRCCGPGSLCRACHGYPAGSPSEGTDIMHEGSTDPGLIQELCCETDFAPRGKESHAQSLWEAMSTLVVQECYLWLNQVGLFGNTAVLGSTEAGQGYQAHCLSLLVAAGALLRPSEVLHPQTVQLIWRALGTGSLAHSWPRALRKYAFCPVSLPAQTLCKVREDEEQPPLAHSPEAGPALSGARHHVAPASRSLEPPRVAPGWDAADLGNLPPAVSPRLNARLESCFLSYKKGAIAAHYDAVDGWSLGKHNFIVRSLRGARRLNPPRSPLVPSWDLSVVLAGLQRGPFEPQESVELKFLSAKTALLTAFPPIKPAYTHIVLRPETTAHSTRSVASSYVLAHGASLADICRAAGWATPNTFARFYSLHVEPVSSRVLGNRALRIYVDCTQSFRSSGQLFVCYGGQQKDKAVSKQRIVDAIILTFQSQDEPCPLGVRAHSTRSVASSYELAHGASLADICRAAGWATPSQDFTVSALSQFLPVCWFPGWRALVEFSNTPSSQTGQSSLTPGPVSGVNLPWVSSRPLYWARSLCQSLLAVVPSLLSVLSERNSGLAITSSVIPCGYQDQRGVCSRLLSSTVLQQAQRLGRAGRQRKSTWHLGVSPAKLNGLRPEIAQAVKGNYIEWKNRRLIAILAHALHAEEQQTRKKEKAKAKTDKELQLALVQAVSRPRGYSAPRYQQTKQARGKGWGGRPSNWTERNPKQRGCAICGTDNHVTRKCSKSKLCKNDGHWSACLVAGESVPHLSVSKARDQAWCEVGRFMKKSVDATDWTFIPNYAILEQPLKALRVGKGLKSCDQIEWTEEEAEAFVNIKVQLSPTLGLPVPTKPFVQMVDEKNGFMTSILLQHHGDRLRPVAYFSSKLDPVAAGLPRCLRAVASAEKAVMASKEFSRVL
ncbi:Gag-Pol polyprotein [Labeo rohita]|uniref:Gag-Pol polyprotein n=1 Tax=Labeo rohita TaxID=84645 RepID=A0ABQ8L704_LABRO|nr:Gag-Pol polyprotein [Labeo rohita]